MSSYIGIRHTQSSKSTNNWERLNSEYHITKPTILCAGGNLTLDDKSANSIAKMAENLIGRHEQDIDILSIIYETKDSSHPIGFVSNQDAGDLTLQIFAPLIMDENCNRLSLKQVCKNLRNITIFQFCYGVEAINKINKILIDLLKSLNYSQNEVRLILQQIFCVGFAPIEDNNANSSFYVKSIDDEKFGNNYIYNKYNADINANQIFLGSGELQKNNNSLTLFTQKLSSPISVHSTTNDVFDLAKVLELFEREHDLSLISRNKSYNPTLYNITHNANTASLCISYALSFSVANSIQNNLTNKFIPLNLNQLFNDCKNIISFENNSCQGKAQYEEYKQHIKALKSISKTIPFYLALEQLDVKEKDILSGKCPISELKYRISGNLNFFNTIYEKIINNYDGHINYTACKKKVKKEEVVKLEIVIPHGFILPSGELIQGDIKNSSLYLKVIEGKKLKGNIQFKVVEKQGEKFLILSNGYGSFNKKYSSIEELIKDWNKYDDCPLTISPTDMQKTVISNLCTQFDIPNKNIILNVTKHKSNLNLVQV